MTMQKHSNAGETTLRPMLRSFLQEWSRNTDITWRFAKLGSRTSCCTLLVWYLKRRVEEIMLVTKLKGAEHSFQITFRNLSHNWAGRFYKPFAKAMTCFD